MTHYAWLGSSRPSDHAVGLIAQASYHLDELVPLRDELQRSGIAAVVLVPIPPRKPLNRLRPGVRRYRELLASTPLRIEAVSDEDRLAAQLRGVVVMNDWGVPRPLVERLRSRGRPTFAWIEGVQDFHDRDVVVPRRPYTRVDHVFALGAYGAEQLGDRPSTIVGSTRLRALWQGPGARPVSPNLVINSNFTYGVLTEQRRDWLRSVVRAARAAGLPWVLSRHAAERGPTFPHRASRRPVGALLAGASHHVGRFSTVCYEALVRGVELAYHNPHGERVETFAEPCGGFARTASTDELADVLRRPVRSADEVRAGAERFLNHHLRLDGDESPAALATAVIADLLGP